MISTQFDISARIKAIPYTGPAIPPKTLATPIVVTPVIPPVNETPAPGTGDNWRELVGITNPLPASLVTNLNGTMSTIGNIINVITPILGLIEYFISTFSSFSSIVSAIVKMTETAVDKWISDLMSTGVYLNVVVPPAYIKNLQSNFDYTKLGNGGYQAFTQRLVASMYNEQDQARPVFSNDAIVGGYIIMIDSETPDEFFAGLKMFNQMFDVMNVLPLPISMSQPAPVNVKAEYGLWTAGGGKDEYGIKLTWNAPAIRTGAYRISRSIQPGGTHTVEDIPLADMNLTDAVKDGLFRIATGGKTKAQQTVYKYNDPAFNNGQPKTIVANPVSGDGYYVDFDLVKLPDGTPFQKQYYYVVEGGSILFNQWGRRSPEVRSKVEGLCVNSNANQVIEHPNGALEYAMPGWQGLGKWSSIQPFKLIPGIPVAVDMLKKMLQSLGGMSKNASKSFVDFINNLKVKVEYYINLLQVIADLINLILELNSSYASIATLEITPQQGGVDNFADRIFRSKPPDGHTFSGVNGITMGIVMLYGIPDGLSDTEKATMQANIQSLSKVFGLMTQIFGGSDKRTQEQLQKIEQASASLKK